VHAVHQSKQTTTSSLACRHLPEVPVIDLAESALMGHEPPCRGPQLASHKAESHIQLRPVAPKAALRKPASNSTSTCEAVRDFEIYDRCHC
jgi:hypothetical protein